MKIKHKDLYALQSAYKAMKEEKIRDFKTNMAIIRSRKLVDNEIEALDQLKEPTEEFQEFEKKRGELASKHARKDKSGTAMLKSTPQGPVYDIEDLTLFQEELQSLMDQYSAALSDRALQEEQYIKALEEYLEIDLAELPEKVMRNMPTDVLDTLYDLISDKPKFYTEGELKTEIEKAVKASNAVEKKKTK